MATTVIGLWHGPQRGFVSITLPQRAADQGITTTNAVWPRRSISDPR
ncbi:hypothetical protein [Paracoccus sp. Ld10]